MGNFSLGEIALDMESLMRKLLGIRDHSRSGITLDIQSLKKDILVQEIALNVESLEMESITPKDGISV